MKKEIHRYIGIAVPLKITWLFFLDTLFSFGTYIILRATVVWGSVPLLTILLTGYHNGIIVNCLLLKTTITTALR